MADELQQGESAIEDLRLRAAIGYFELGMLEQAWEELGEVAEPLASSLAAVRVRVMVLLKEERWRRAHDEAKRICELDPEGSEGPIHMAYCLHELGETAEAERVLINGPVSLREEAIYFYNLACYKAVRGEVPEAQALLEKAVSMDEGLYAVAQKDPDLREVVD
ncbi:MAG: hypothetical protein P8J87_00025 [Verrucomicrobiales bacterium]|nr:hypothetical protein [Verrucomicrobiales bacterium]